MVFQIVTGFINILDIISLLGLDDEERCEEGWIGVSLALQCLFIIALVFNIISMGLLRIELVTRMKKYFHYKHEPEIAIKY